MCCEPVYRSLLDLTQNYQSWPWQTNHLQTLPDKEQPGIYIIKPDQPGWLQEVLLYHQLVFNNAMAKEGYLLLVLPDKIIIAGSTASGILYGLQTLRFLVNGTNEENSIPCVAIQDWPRFPVRGISDDISRGQVSTMAHFKHILDFMSRYKMNVYMPYLEDMFIFNTIPAIGQNRGALTAQECIELQDYAEKLCIEVIPIFQTLGHFENILIQPEFIHHAEFPGSSSLNPVSEHTYALLEQMLDEFLPVFRSVWFNMGADESWDIGHGASRSRAEQVGVAQVHAEHYRRVIDIISKHNKRIMMYGDIILDYPDILQQLPSDIMIVDWHYDLQTRFSSTQLFANSGKPYLVSPGTQSWSRIFPDLAHARANIKGMVKDGDINGADGVITSAWGDFGGGNWRELNYYPWACGAALAWNPARPDTGDFDAAFIHDFYGADLPNMALVYQLLSACSDYYDLNHFFGHPFYAGQRNESRFLKRASELRRTAEQVQAALSGLRPQVMRNQEHLNILDLCARMYAWTGDLYNLRLDMVRIAGGCPADKNSLVAQIDHLQTRLSAIQKRYGEIWQRYFKPDNLHRLLALMDRVTVHLKSKQAAIGNGNYELDGRLDTPFITSKDKANAKMPLVVLYRSFKLDAVPEKAWLQLIANSHAHAWINGQYIGEAVACRTLSAVVEAERVKLWPVTEVLQPGDNEIIISVRNYRKDGVASANVWLQGFAPDVLVTSDDRWLAQSMTPFSGDMKPSDRQEWPAAVATPNNWIICRPDLAYELPSRVEFYREFVV